MSDGHLYDFAAADKDFRERAKHAGTVLTHRPCPDRPGIEPLKVNAENARAAADTFLRECHAGLNLSSSVSELRFRAVLGEQAVHYDQFYADHRVLGGTAEVGVQIRPPVVGDRIIRRWEMHLQTISRNRALSWPETDAVALGRARQLFHEQTGLKQCKEDSISSALSEPVVVVQDGEPIAAWKINFHDYFGDWTLLMKANSDEFLVAVNQRVTIPEALR